MKQSISLPHVDSQHIRGEIAGRRSGQNTLKVKQQTELKNGLLKFSNQGLYSHILSHSSF